MSHSRARNITVRALLIVGGWTLFALFGISQSYVARAYNQRINMRPIVLFELLDMELWAPLTPLIFWLAGKLVIRRENWRWTVPANIAMGAVFSLIQLSVLVQFLPAVGYRTGPGIVRTVILNRFHAGVLTCWALIGIRHAMEYYRQFRMRELAASQLEAKLALARVEMLKMQLQLHYLFNTMHAISALMYRDLPAADRMIARLSDFLRLTLDSAGVQEVSLRREME